MSKKTKITVAILAVIAIVIVVIFVVKNQSNSYSTDDLYENMQWGMSPGEVKSKAIDLGETWEDIPIDLGEKIVYKAEGTNFDGNEGINYQLMYIFKEEKLWSVYLKFEDDNCNVDLDKFFKQLSKGFDSKYEKSELLDSEEEGYETWESDRSVINCFKTSSSVSLVYENIKVKEEYK